MIKRLYRVVDRAAQNKLTIPLLLVAVAAASALLVGALRLGRSDNGNAESDDVVRYSEDIPSEVAIPDTYSTKTGEVKSIEIPSAGIKGFIQKVGVDQNRAVAAPNNVHLAGWFVDSVKPGDKGLSIIDGHVSGRSADGVFKKLPEVRPDDEVIMTMGGGQKFTYIVFDTKTVPNDQAASALFEQNPRVSHQLNLITCTGRYDAGSRTYADRVIVYASLQQ